MESTIFDLMPDTRVIFGVDHLIIDISEWLHPNYNITSNMNTVLTWTRHSSFDKEISTSSLLEKTTHNRDII